MVSKWGILNECRNKTWVLKHFISFSRRGIRNSHLYFENSTARWRLQSLRDPNKMLDMAEKNPDVLPIGTHNWEAM